MMMKKKVVAAAVLLAVFLSYICGAMTAQAAQVMPETQQPVPVTPETQPAAQVTPETQPVLLATPETQQAVLATPETQQTVQITLETQAAQDSAVAELSPEALAAYYKESVFIGDSIMLGFRNYCAKQKDSYVNGISFLAVGSYSALNASKPVAGQNVHPMYQGKKYQIWDAVLLMNVKRAFILLGMNDIGILGLERARDQYKEVIDKVIAASPGIEINIISVTYTLKDKGKAKLNNKNIAQYNILLKEMAEANGWGYVDAATPISDGNGNLAPGSCSDGFVHLSRSAYAIWETLFRDYANTKHNEKNMMQIEEKEAGESSEESSGESSSAQ